MEAARGMSYLIHRLIYFVFILLMNKMVLHLALEAYRREEISKGKLRDLSTLLDFSAKDLLMLAEAA